VFLDRLLGVPDRVARQRRQRRLGHLDGARARIEGLAEVALLVLDQGLQQAVLRSRVRGERRGTSRGACAQQTASADAMNSGPWSSAHRPNPDAARPFRKGHPAASRKPLLCRALWPAVRAAAGDFVTNSAIPGRTGVQRSASWAAATLQDRTPPKS